MNGSRQRVLAALESMSIPARSFESGDVLIAEGTSGREVYVLRDGEAHVTYEGRPVATLDEPGVVLGELAALLDSKRTATVTVLRPSHFFVISDLPGLLKTHSDFAIVLMRELAEQILSREAIHADVYVGLSRLGRQ